MKILRTRKAIELYRKKRTSKKILGFVPTMGALHAGHLSLVKRAQKECDQVIVSIFVNPTQFGPAEDYLRYPRTETQDIELLKRAGVDAVFIPKDANEVYERDSDFRIQPPTRLTEMMEGLKRPGHFSGVATVLGKLFSLVQPQRAFFGEKDYQQLQIVRSLVAELFLKIKIVGVPTLREPNGLAMSSRNMYLSPRDRERAGAVSQCLKESMNIDEARARLGRLGFGVEYLECWSEDLTKRLPGPKGRWLIAAQFCGVRLIDNIRRHA